jgi:hypothetical protein
MSDVREDILARLLEVVATIPNLRSVHRNNVDLAENQLPAGIVFDADEETTGGASTRQSNSPIKVEMTPEIVIAQQSGEAGSDLTTLRKELIKRVLLDTELNNLVAKGSPRGEAAIHYVGCQTDVGWMRSLHGALRAQFTFAYWLKPNEL